MNLAVYDASRELSLARDRVRDAESHLAWLHDRQQRAAEAMDAYLGGRLPDDREKFRAEAVWEDDAYRLWDTEHKTTPGHRIVNAARPPTDKQIADAKKAIQSAKSAVTKTEKALQAAKDQPPMEAPEDFPTEGRYLAGKGIVRLFGERYIKGQPIPDATIAALGATKIDRLVEVGYLKDTISKVPA